MSPNTLAVVIDVLRASTTICTALHYGAREIIPVAEIEDALKLASTLGRDTVLLAGERHGTKPEGFDLGNSPLEYQSEQITNRTIVFTTTNGTRVLQMVRATQPIIAGFVNLSAVVATLLREYHRHPQATLSIFCAGTNGQFALEDALAAGALVARLQRHIAPTLNDGARAALLLYHQCESTLPEVIAATDHAQRLRQLGFASDIAFALHTDQFETVPRMRQGTIQEEERNKTG